MKALLEKLVRIPSVSNDKEQLHSIINICKNYFVGLPGVFIELLERNGKPSLVIKNFAGKEADVVLNGHLDVVPPSEKNQFEPHERDGKLYARGASDMKSGVAVMMTVMKDLLVEGYTQKAISLILTCDEELGGRDGAEKIVEAGYRGRLVLIPDGGSMNEIVYGEKGMYVVGITATGSGCHGSRPWLGENAIEKVIGCYQAIRQELHDAEVYTTEDHRGTTVSLTTISGGTASNVIPSEAKLTMDIRFNEQYSSEIIKKRVAFHVQDRGCTIAEGGFIGEALYTDPMSRPVQDYLAIAQDGIEGEVVLCKEHGGSDGRYFAATGSVVLLQKARGGNIHGENERVILDDLETLYQIYRRAIKEMHV